MSTSPSKTRRLSVALARNPAEKLPGVIAAGRDDLALGLTFSGDTELCFERFEILAVFAPADARV